MQFSAACPSRYMYLQSLCDKFIISFIACRCNPYFSEKLFGGLGFCGRLKVWGRSEHVPLDPVPKRPLSNTSFNHASFIARPSNNMWILPLVGYIGLGLGFGFLTLAIGTSLSSLGSFADAYRFHSVRTLLPLRTRRRTYCVRQETPHAPHLRRDLYTSSALSHRWLPFLVVPP
jgi:hypothetical protein